MARWGISWRLGSLAQNHQARGTRIEIESVYSRSGGVTTTIVHSLYAGDGSRTERLDPPATVFEIERRDLRQRFRVFVSQREYQVAPLFDLATEQEMADFRHSGRYWHSRFSYPTRHASRALKIVFTYQPTDEQRSMFGCIARQWIVRRRDEPDRRFGENWTEAITDAWYLDTRDVSARFSGFSGGLVHHAFCYATVGDERPVISHSGRRPSGLCVSSQTKHLRHIEFPSGEMRDDTENSSVHVMSIAEGSFPLSVFEPPKGFRKIPVYPTRFTMARLDLSRRLKRYFRN
jgi:hypothetical protein